MAKAHKSALNTIAKKQDSPVDLLLIGVGGKQAFVRSTDIKEVLRPSELTPVAMGPAHVIGLSNIRGQIVCIIDPGGVTSLPCCHRESTSRTRFLVLRHDVMHVGIWVDEVCKIQQVDRSVLANSDENGDSVRYIEVDGVEYALLQCSALLH